MYFAPMRTLGLVGIALLSNVAAIHATNGQQAKQVASNPEPRLTVEPRQPSTGALVRLTIDRVARHGDSVVAVSGSMAGEPLHFRPATSERLQALGAIPIDASDSVVAHVRIERESGAVDTLRLSVRFPHNPPPQSPAASRARAAGAARLKVDKVFTQKMDSATNARIEHENELARDVGRRAQDMPQLWEQPFLRPRPSRVTSRFGSGRVFNGRVSSSHLGIDYRGAVGDPIYAANRGVVALVANFFLAGDVVYIDHGDGLMTAYFHMSQAEVAVGDTVARGQEIGVVGATGRVTGPHLHWSARFGALTIDPADLLALSAPFVAGATGRASK
jgi:murein DD-endopeptidase MepM/ murein hydrolase activator NlpD